MTQIEAQRLDKWLWAARFFKTRKLATDAITGGKVHLNGQRTKPGKDIHVGSKLEVVKEPYQWEFEVLILNKQRRPAAEATLMYQESQQSIEIRQAESIIQRERREHFSTKDERPTKKQRRQIHQFRSENLITSGS
jgi:ribosome-associated heat shock protein Hsp15